MALSIATGLADEGDILSNEIKVDMDDVIAQLEANTTQFTTFLMKASSRACHRSTIEWLEDQLFPRLTSALTSGTSAASAFAVASGEGTYIRANDVLRICTTGEAVEVLSVSTDTLTVTRGIGSVTAAAFSAGAQIVIIGNASAQGATLGTRKITNRVRQYNYTQIFRHPYGFPNTLVETELFGGPMLNKERRKKAVEHKRAIEYTFFWGARDYQTSQGANSTEPQTFCGGLFEYISSYVKDPSGTMDKTEFEGFMRDGYQYGSGNKVLFCSPLVAQVLSGFARDNWVRSSPNDNIWGVQVDAFISGIYGSRLPVIVKRDWNEFATTSSQWGGWAFLVDMDSVQARPMKNRNTKLLRNRQANDADETTEEYLTEISLQVEHEKHHMIIKNVTG